MATVIIKNKTIILTGTEKLKYNQKRSNVNIVKKSSIYQILYIPDIYYILPVSGNIYDINRDDCIKKYVGKTKPKLNFRLKEHQAH